MRIYLSALIPNIMIINENKTRGVSLDDDGYITKTF
jgi:hypothetical protein